MNYMMDFTDQELGTVITAIMELPYKTAAPLMNKINQRIMEQQKAMQEVQAQTEPPVMETEPVPAE